MDTWGHKRIVTRRLLVWKQPASVTSFFHNRVANKSTCKQRHLGLANRLGMFSTHRAGEGTWQPQPPAFPPAMLTQWGLGKKAITKCGFGKRHVQRSGLWSVWRGNLGIVEPVVSVFWEAFYKFHT
mmetsp:Transcript_103356/g.296821  ORF Transcript_103356/g.296821 Transcript_103356/m.296821 type:complete len:126 (+) Transcript_103356:326-703(+)